MGTRSVFFLLGILSLVQFSRLPPLFFTALLPVCLVLMLRSRRLRWLAWFCCGFLWALLRADMILDGQLQRGLEGRALTVEGRVVSLPVTRDISTRFEFVIDKLVDGPGEEGRVPARVRLSWYRHAPVLIPGERWRLKIKLKRPYGFMNPGGFDYEGWLFQNGIGASGYVMDGASNVRLRGAAGHYADRLRYRLREELGRILAASPSLSLVRGLAIGDRSGITPAQWRILINTGTNHLLAISGLHIGLIAGLVFFITRWLWPLSGSLALLIAGPRIAAVNAIIAAAGYAALAGFSIPTRRALIMLGVLMILSIFNRRSGGVQIIAVALLSILILDPFAVMSAGFWLSFSAIVVIAYGMAHRVGMGGLWWRWGRIQYLLALGLIPLLTLWFNQVPVLGFVANFIAVPWISLLTVPLVLGGVILLMVSESAGRLLLELGTGSLDLVWIVLQAIAAVNFTVFPIAAPATAVLFAALIGVLLLLMPRGLPGRWLGIVWMLPLFCSGSGWRQTDAFSLILLDVGQGLAAVVRTGGHTLLYDTGPRYSDSFNAGSGVVLPYLRHEGITGIDMLIQSHGDSDHIGGLDDILAGLPVARILSSVPGRINHPGARPCQAGQGWQWDGVMFEILSPQGDSRLRGNDLSCVLRVSHGDRTLLLTGDIEAAAEREMVRRYGDGLASRVMVAPHHGSATSSSPGLLERVRPELALFPVGYRNRFGFPKQDIIVRYREYGARMLDSAASGAIEVRFGESGIRVIRYRLGARRFWHTLF